jgi:hypothetical protein
MTTKPSISHIRRGATALTSEAGKLIRDGALNAAHQALVMALQTVKAADRKLRNVPSPRRKAARAGRVSGKRKAARVASKPAPTGSTASRRPKASRRGRRVAR